MHYWRFLLLAFLAAFQPIASFTERNLVNGRQECCDRQTHSLLQGSRQLYGTPRDGTSSPDDRRLDHRDQTRDERRYELKNSVLTRTPIGRFSDPLERDTIRFTQDQFRAERRVSRKTQERSNHILGTSGSLVRENDVDGQFIRRSPGLSRAREENERRPTSNSQEISRMNDREEHRRTIKDRRNLDQRKIRDEVQSNIINNNDRRLNSERQQERRETLFRSSRTLEENLAERRSLDRRMRENNEQHRRSLSAEARMSSQIRNERDQIRADRINSRATERIVHRVQPNDFTVNRMRVSADQNIESRISDTQITRERLYDERHPDVVLRMANRNIRLSRSSREESPLAGSQEGRSNDVRRYSSARREVNEGSSRNEREIRISNEINERLNTNQDRMRTEARRVHRDEKELSRGMRFTERYSRLGNREEREQVVRSREENSNDGRRLSTISRDNNEGSRNFQEVRRDERQFEVDARLNKRSIIRDNIRRPLSIALNHQESERLSRTSREIRSDEYSRLDSHEERLSRSRREIRNDNRITNRFENRFNKHEVRRDESQRSMDMQTLSSRVLDHDRKTVLEVRRSLNRDKLAMSALSRSAETIRERDASRRIRDFTDHESINQTRNLKYARNRDIIASTHTMNRQPENSTISLNWQTILYTMQGIYLCGFLMQVLSQNESNKGKTRYISWFVPTNHLIKVD